MVPNIRILLSDFNDDYRLAVRRGLSGREGLEVVGDTRSGVEALKLARELKPDVLVTEAVMGDMDGFELSELLRKQLEQDCPAIMMVTAYSSNRVIEEASALRLDKLAFKPVGLKSMAATIRELAAARSKAHA